MDEIALANQSRYGDISEVENYLKLPYHRKRIKVALSMLNDFFRSYPYKSTITVLELGGASGTVGNMIKKLGYNVIVTDFSNEAVVECKKKGLRAELCDVTQDFPFQEKQFDAIFAGEIIEHLFNPNHFLIECRRVLKDNGVLILTTPNLASLDDRFGFFFGYSPRQIDPLHPYRYLHIRPYTLKMLKSVLKYNNFRFLRVKSNYIRIKIYKQKECQIGWLADVFASWGGSLIVSASKIPC